MALSAPAVVASAAPGNAEARGVEVRVRLDGNENPLGPSPRALRAAFDCLEGSHRYPDETQAGFKARLAESLGCSSAEIAVGNGSGELIERLFRVLAPGAGHVVAPRLSFVAYRQCAEQNASRLAEAPVGSDWSVDVGALLAAIEPRTCFVVLANPNNPTGAALDTHALFRLGRALSDRRIPLVLDYAYWEYAQGASIPPPLAMVRAFANVIVLRTFSKACGLAGLRVGYAVGAPDVVGRLTCAQPPYTVSQPALAAASAALQDDEHLARTVALTRVERESLAARLRALGLHVHVGPTNFVLVDLGRPARPVHVRLLQRGIAVRLMEAYGLARCLRVSVGLPAENDALVAALAAILLPAEEA